MLTLENLGRLVQEKRGDQGIRAAAKEIGLSHATLSRIERGHLPDVENYQKICRWLGIEMTDLPMAPRSSPIPQVHFRMEDAVSPTTAKALAQLILTAQKVLMQRRSQGSS